MNATVTKMVDEVVNEKVDTNYIRGLLSHVNNLGIMYVCINDDRYEDGDDWIDPEDGIRYIIIKLDYQEVKQTPDIRPMMLAKLRERLGNVA